MDSESEIVSLRDQPQIFIINKVLENYCTNRRLNLLVNGICKKTSTNKTKDLKGKKMTKYNHVSKDKAS